MRTDRAIARAERTAARALVRALHAELGITGTARVLARVALGRVRGEPFAALGPAADERDRLSRRQAADLVVLARAVERRRDRDTAVRVARAAVLAGGVRFLSLMIPAGAAADTAAALAERFFNAEGEARVVDDERFTFTVTRCRFVELLTAVDAAHLAPLFCEVDNHYFADPSRPIQLTRTRTLATGGGCCDFEFTAR